MIYNIYIINKYTEFCPILFPTFFHTWPGREGVQEVKEGNDVVPPDAREKIVLVILAVVRMSSIGIFPSLWLLGGS